MSDYLVFQETLVNETEGYIMFESDEQEAWTGNLGKLFKTLQKEFGKCTSKMYVDKNGTAIQSGWVFQKKCKYTDCSEHYLQTAWISIFSQKSEIIKTHFNYWN